MRQSDPGANAAGSCYGARNVIKVLIVDDSPIDRKLAGRIVEKTGELTPCFAPDARAALAVVVEDAPAIVVTDLLMPGMGGLELVAELRKRHPLIPVVVMTAHGSEETAVAALSAGAASYVPKRSLASELEETILNVLSVARGAQDERRVYEALTEGRLLFELGHDSADVNALVRWLESIILRLEICDSAEAIQIGVALREALVNAVEHGNLGLDSELKESGPKAYDAQRTQRKLHEPYTSRRVKVSADICPTELRWTITDQGEGFDPGKVPDPTDPMNLDRSYGRGLLLIRTFMDHVAHNETGNEITMIKRRKPDNKREEA